MSGICKDGSECRWTRGQRGEASVFGAADWLHLAAAPAFATMALLTAVFGGGASDMLCSPMIHGMPSLGGMALMYWLMSAFHLPPWLKLTSRRSNAGRC